MSEFVTPIDLYLGADEQVVLADQLKAIVSEPETTRHLYTRNLYSEVTSFGKGAKSQDTYQTVFRAYKDHTNAVRGTFVLTGYEQQVVGLARIYPNTVLSRHKLPVVLPRLIGRLATDFIDTDGPLLRAWLAPGEGNEGGVVVRNAYRELANPKGIAKKFYDKHMLLNDTPGPESARPWTIESLDSPNWIHRAISATLADTHVSGKFDDGSAKLFAPGQSKLYIAG